MNTPHELARTLLGVIMREHSLDDLEFTAGYISGLIAETVNEQHDKQKTLHRRAQEAESRSLALESAMKVANQHNWFQRVSDFWYARRRQRYYRGLVKSCRQQDRKAYQDVLDRAKKFEALYNTHHRALQSLTPGGSEFHNDPDNCVAFVKNKEASNWASIKKGIYAIRERDTVIEGLRRDLEVALHDIQVMETYNQQLAAALAAVKKP